MATNIPPHNLREVAEGVTWHLDHPEAEPEELLEALIGIIKGPDFPTAAQIVGTRGIQDAYRTGRGTVVMRAVTQIEEIHGKNCIIATELPYQVNPDKLAERISELVKSGEISGIAEMRDETSGRTGQRLVIGLRKDAVPNVVLNNLYKHTSLQESFNCNMLALVDGVPKRLKLSEFVTLWTKHQISVIVRRTRFRLREAEARAHILVGLLLAIDMIDQVIALIRRSPQVEDAKRGLCELLKIDEVQAVAILDLQLRRLAALERQKIADERDALLAKISEYKAILESPERQRDIIKGELAELVKKYGDERKTEIVPYHGDLADEAYIKKQDVVVTVTKSGFVKTTPLDDYKTQKRGGKGLKGAKLKDNDTVEHFFITSTHDWILFFTNFGRVYKLKAYQISLTDRVSKGKHIAGLLTLMPDEKVSQVLTLSDAELTQEDRYLVLATRQGLVKKTPMDMFANINNRGKIAITLGEGDELMSAEIAERDSEIMLVSKHGYALHTSTQKIRSTGRSARGVRGLKFREASDYLLFMGIVDDPDTETLLTVTNEGYAKRTKISEFAMHGRGTKGMRALKFTEKKGLLSGALVVKGHDEIMIIMNSGMVLRTVASQINLQSRAATGVILARPDADDEVIAVSKNDELADEEVEISPGTSAEKALGADNGDVSNEAGVADVSAVSGEGSVTIVSDVADENTDADQTSDVVDDDPQGD
jgi:DNA gyrase subunit A